MRYRRRRTRHARMPSIHARFSRCHYFRSIDGRRYAEYFTTRCRDYEVNGRFYFSASILLDAATFLAENSHLPRDRAEDDTGRIIILQSRRLPRERSGLLRRALFTDTKRMMDTRRHFSIDIYSLLVYLLRCRHYRQGVIFMENKMHATAGLRSI